MGQESIVVIYLVPQIVLCFLLLYCFSYYLTLCFFVTNNRNVISAVKSEHIRVNEVKRNGHIGVARATVVGGLTGMRLGGGSVFHVSPFGLHQLGLF